MKKLLNSKMFTFILGGIIFSSIAVGVYALNANEITYNDTTVAEAIDDLYDKSDIKRILDSKNSFFGGQGVSFNGFIVGHKYLAVYASNFWNYNPNEEYSAYINHGAENINVLTGGCDVNERTTNGGRACAYIITFTATDNTITLNYGNSSTYYSMKFIDISQ